MRCLWCHKDVAAGWALCPDCGSELEAGPSGSAPVPTYRPAGQKAFDPFVIASVRRFTPGGPLLVLGVNGRIEANVVPAADGVACVDISGPELFRVQRYEAVAGGLVAFTGEGEPLATYLPDGAGLLLREGATAPAARVRPQKGSADNYDVVETGADGRLASCWRQPCEVGDLIDEQWTLLPVADGNLPLALLALIALPLVCAARFGRPPRPVDRDRFSSAIAIGGGLLDLLR